VQATPRTVRTPHGQSSSNLNQQQQQQQQQVQFHQQQASLGYHDPAGGGGNGDPNHLEPLSEYGYYDREYEDEPDDYGQALSMRQAAEPELHPAFANPAFTSEDHYPLVAPTGAYLQEEPGYPADRGPMSWPPTTENLDPLASWPPAMTYAACIPATPYRVSAGGLPQSPLPAAAGVEPAAYDPFAGLPSGSGTFGNPSYPLTHFQAAANAQVYVNPTSVVWGKQVIPPPEYLRELEQQNIILWSTQKQLSKILQDEESQKWLKLLQVSLMTVLKLNPVQQLTVRPKDAAFTEEDVWRETAHFQSGESAVTAKGQWRYVVLVLLTMCVGGVLTVLCSLFCPSALLLLSRQNTSTTSSVRIVSSGRRRPSSRRSSPTRTPKNGRRKAKPRSPLSSI
jgi:hypothetical protein